MSGPTGREPALPQDTYLTGREPFVSGKEWVVEPEQWRQIYDDTLAVMVSLQARTIFHGREVHITDRGLLGWTTEQLGGHPDEPLTEIMVYSFTGETDNLIGFNFYRDSAVGQVEGFALFDRGEEAEFRNIGVNIEGALAWRIAKGVLSGLREMREKASILNEWIGQLANHPRLRVTDGIEKSYDIEIALLDEQREYLEVMLKARGMLNEGENLTIAGALVEHLGMGQVIVPDIFLEFFYWDERLGRDHGQMRVKIKYLNSTKRASRSWATPWQSGSLANEHEARISRHERDDFTQHPVEVMREVMRVLGSE